MEGALGKISARRLHGGTQRQYLTWGFLSCTDCLDFSQSFMWKMLIVKLPGEFGGVGKSVRTPSEYQVWTCLDWEGKGWRHVRAYRHMTEDVGCRGHQDIPGSRHWLHDSAQNRHTKGALLTKVEGHRMPICISSGLVWSQPSEFGRRYDDRGFLLSIGWQVSNHMHYRHAQYVPASVFGAHEQVTF